jgi:protein-disulfide isomerase
MINIGKFIGIALLAAGAASAAPGDAVCSTGNTALVSIDNAQLTAADLERRLPGRLFQARNTYYEAERKAVDELVDEYLLDAQAKKEGVSVPALLERHVNSAIAKDPTDEALSVYYEGLDTQEPFAAVRDKILDALRQRRLARAKTAYLQTLRGQVKVAVQLTPPRAGISMAGAPRRGPADAPVTVVEYADYECPYCLQFQPGLEKLEAEFKGKLAFVYKDVPLPMHAHAQKAAEAAHCAEAQGKYWEYHDLLFASKGLEISQLKEGARSLKLNGEAFDKCLDSGEQADRVKQQLTEAQSLGIPGTPAFFVNGRGLNANATSYETLRQAVEEELRAVAAAKGVESAAAREPSSPVRE